LLGGAITFFGSLFIRFLYVQNPIFGILAFIVCCIVLTNLIYFGICKDYNKDDKNEP
jgi:hypothetical protein